METWQKDHITTNLESLISMTTCTCELLAYLLSQNILSVEEYEKLTQQSLTNNEKSANLYMILFTRKNSFNALVNALQTNNQSGAVEILKNCTDKFQIDKQYGTFCYNEKDLLGKGSCGTKVYKGNFCGRDVAIKVQSTQLLAPDMAEKEIEFLLKLDDHHNVLKYFSATTHDNLILIAFELCTTSLKDAISMKQVEVESVDILIQCTEGLKHLHDHDVIHENLKPANILLTSYKQVKISDFGFSKQISNGQASARVSSFRGFPKYTAPEILEFSTTKDVCDNPMRVTCKADVFSLGCVYYFTLSGGEHPFGEGFEIPTNIIRGKYNLLNTNISWNWLDLIRNMISHDANKRPTTSDVLNQTIFCASPEKSVEIKIQEIQELLTTTLTNTSIHEIVRESPKISPVPKRSVTTFRCILCKVLYCFVIILACFGLFCFLMGIVLS